MRKKLEGQYVVGRQGSDYNVKYTTDYWYPINGAAARVEMIVKRYSGRGAKSRAMKYRDELLSNIKPDGDYTTRAGESLMGIALRQLGDETRWNEIRSLNTDKWPDIGAHDYLPPGTNIKLPCAERS